MLWHEKNLCSAEISLQKYLGPRLVQGAAVIQSHPPYWEPDLTTTTTTTTDKYTVTNNSTSLQNNSTAASLATRGKLIKYKVS